MLRRVQPRRSVTLLVAGSWWLAVVVAAQPGIENTSSTDAAPPLPLRRIAEVKSWSALADQGLYVDIDGVVTCVAPAGNFFLQDGAMGIHVAQPEAGVQLKPGDRVRVLGATRRGAFAPSIEPREIVPLGSGALPSPRHASYNEVASGTLDGQLLQIGGVVCDVTLDAAAQVPVLDLATDGRRLRVTVYGVEPVRPEALVDAEVLLTGVASGSFNRQRQLMEPALRVPNVSFISVLRPPPENPFAAPLLPLPRLLGFSMDAPGLHRVRIRGVVTRQISARELFIRDESLGLRIEARAPVSARPGDVIDAVGFPAMTRGAAVLENALVRVVSSAAPPEPFLAHGATLFDGTHTGDLVRVRARLVDWVAAGEMATLVLQNENELFRGTVRDPLVTELLPEKGSIVDLTGICATGPADEGGENTRNSLVLLLANPVDITVVQRPDWWTPARLWRALGVVLILLISGLGWVWALRRQVRRKAAIIQQQARHAAVLEERSRIARDLHDTIEQGLTGLSLQLKLVEMDCKTAPQNVEPGIEAARQMLRQSRALAHNAIRELRTDDFARRTESLVAEIRLLVETWRQSGIGISVSVDGTEYALPSSAERQLLHIAGEAITNAIKHGQATSIELGVRYRPHGVQLRVRDNGSGFDPETAAATRGGSFGLIGMNERAVSMGAKLEILSGRGAGTTIVVDVPAAESGARGRRESADGAPAHPGQPSSVASK